MAHCSSTRTCTTGEVDFDDEQEDDEHELKTTENEERELHDETTENGSSSKQQQPQRSRRDRPYYRRVGLLVCSVLYTFFYVGAFFGWGPMQLLLEENGSFAWKCDEGDAVDATEDTTSSSSALCSQQTAALINVNFIGQVTQILSPGLGWIADHYGAPTLAYVMVGCCWTGLALLLIAVSELAIDSLLYVAFVLLAVTTWSGGILTVQTGMYFGDGQGRSRVIFCLNALFDAGAITYLCLRAFKQAVDISLVTLLSLYGAVAVVLFGISVYFWTVAVPVGSVEADDNVPLDNKGGENEDENNATASLSIQDVVCLGSTTEEDLETNHSNETEPRTPCEPEMNPNEMHNGGGLEQDRESDVVSDCSHETNDDTDESSQRVENGFTVGGNGRLTTGTGTDATIGECDDLPLPSQCGADSFPTEPPTKDIDGTIRDNSRYSGDAHDEGADSAAETDYILVADRTQRQQLTSFPFILLLVFFSIHVTSNQWTLTTARDFLAYLGDNEVNNRYLTIFTLLQPASVCAFPLVDYCLIRYGFKGAFQVINVLSLGYNIIKVSADNLKVQVAGFLFFTFFRSFLFGITFSFLPSLLAPNVNGKATGIMFLTTGVTAFINIPLSNLAIERMDGNFFVPNLIYTLLVLPCIVAAWLLGCAVDRENAIRDAASERARLRKSYGGVLLKTITE